MAFILASDASLLNLRRPLGWRLFCVLVYALDLPMLWPLLRRHLSP